METSVISYLTARPSHDLIVASNQQITQEWWQKYQAKFDLYVSQLVIQEASKGDQNAAQQRLQVLDKLPLLEANEKMTTFAKKLVQDGRLLPKGEKDDALHIAIATLNGMDYLLTWDVKHLANMTIRGKVEQLCWRMGYKPPFICTPRELLKE